MNERIRPAKSNKITVRVLAAGFSGFFAILQLPYAKSTLDITYYGYHIDLYTPINVIVFLAAMSFNVIVGGTFLTNIKGHDKS